MRNIKYVLLIVVMTIFCSCGSRTNKSSENVRQNISGTKYRRYATEALAIALDIPMRPSAAYDDGTPFYGQGRRYYSLSDNEINTIKTILSDNRKWQEVDPKFPALNINEYYRQYLAYKKHGNIYVLANLYKYFYIVVAHKNVVGASSPAKSIHIISLANDRSRSKYDNVTILLNLSRKQILEVRDV